MLLSHTHTHTHALQTPNPTSQCQSLWVRLAEGAPSAIRPICHLCLAKLAITCFLSLPSFRPFGTASVAGLLLLLLHRGRRSCCERRVVEQFRYFGWLFVNTLQGNWEEGHEIHCVTVWKMQFLLFSVRIYLFFSLE